MLQFQKEAIATEIASKKKYRDPVKFYVIKQQGRDDFLTKTKHDWDIVTANCSVLREAGDKEIETEWTTRIEPNIEVNN